jgi:hypothetical protein
VAEILITDGEKLGEKSLSKLNEYDAPVADPVRTIGVPQLIEKLTVPGDPFQSTLTLKGLSRPLPLIKKPLYLRKTAVIAGVPEAAAPAITVFVNESDPYALLTFRVTVWGPAVVNV